VHIHIPAEAVEWMGLHGAVTFTDRLGAGGVVKGDAGELGTTGVVVGRAPALSVSYFEIEKQ
jgi:hypothetical protein